MTRATSLRCGSETAGRSSAVGSSTLVLGGEKTATGGLAGEYAPYTDEPLPPVDGGSVLLGVDDAPLAVLETTEVRVLRAWNVDPTRPVSGRP